MVKKASGIMRDEYNQLELRYIDCAEEVERLLKKEEDVGDKVEAVK